MIKLLQWLIYGHNHKWEVIDKRGVEYGDVLIGQRYTCQCKGCGTIKVFNTYE